MSWQIQRPSLDDVTHSGRHLMSATRVGGVGVAIFILGAFLIFCVLLCAFGTKARKPGLVYTLSTLIFAIVATVLLASPKGLAPPPAPQGHDDTVIPLIVMCTLVVVGILVSLVGLVMFSLQIPVYARPLSHHTDILRQY